MSEEEHRSHPPEQTPESVGEETRIPETRPAPITEVSPAEIVVEAPSISTETAAPPVAELQTPKLTEGAEPTWGLPPAEAPVQVPVPPEAPPFELPLTPAMPPPPPATQVAAVQDDDRLMAALAWVSMIVLQLPIVSFILLVVEPNKNRPFQRYHAVTSMLFWGVALVYEVVAATAFTVLTVISLGCLAVCLWVIFFVPHIIALYCALMAFTGKTPEIPVLSKLAREQGWL